MNTTQQRGPDRMPIVSPLRILVVDDSASFGDLAAALLAREPCAEVVGVARSGTEALEVVATTQPELVLMDVNMSPMSGLTTSVIIGWLFPQTRVVMMSTDDSPRLRAECAACGAEGFIHKAEFISEFFTAVGPIARDAVRDRLTLLPAARSAALATAS